MKYENLFNRPDSNISSRMLEPAGGRIMLHNIQKKPFRIKMAMVPGCNRSIVRH